MNKKYSELAELFRSEKTDEEILDFLLNYHKNDIADMMAGMTEEEQAVNIKLRRLNAKYKAFSKAAGLPEQRERMKVLY